MDRFVSSEELYLAENEVVAAEAAYIRTRSPAALESVCDARQNFEGLLAERHRHFDESL